ncbi:MAG TPA: bifunctional alpha,alpha-trehalose-phosphate synthase (UDP-forming)/trehalose-phosphatase [Chitinophagales bacterium]|nr:bifunctional alpha,alpha-trehalose-phosphate synthase (UDP-forming)/trehalose-phosphatase [Chitinophagales bacterium]
MPMPSRRRLIIVSYRLPFKLNKDGKKFELHQNSGGLVSAILSFSEKLKSLSLDHLINDIVWVGFSEHTKKDFRKAQNGAASLELHPVFLEEEMNTKFYGGFSNDLLWPLLHYFPSFAVFDDSYYEEFVKANQIFCDEIVKMLRPGDLVWVHDYHFLLLPQMVRERARNVSIGFFLHIPFPSFEIFRLLPHRWREPIMRGILGADLVGFQTLDYAYHFLKTVRKVLGIDHLNRILLYDDRKIKAGAFPISIDYEKFREATLRPEAGVEIQKLKELLGGQKLIFSVDRLDYTKGIVHRLQGYELFLKEHPEWRERVVFNMVIVPSRDEIPKYKEMHNQIDALTGRINSEYSTLAWRPILYQYKSLQFEEMIALYDMSDVGLITPVRDGMNLVAKEYVASQRHTTGVLILSEMTGAAAELQEALMVNPTDKKEIADAILQALEMPEEERKQRMQRMQLHLKEYDVVDWTTDFIQQLNEVKKMNQTESSNALTPGVIRSITQDYHRAHRRILFFDYDGTLVPIQPNPDAAIPDEALLQMLYRFGSDEKNIVVLVSGRSREFLDRWFGKLPLTLVAEHGAFTRMPFSDWIRITPESVPWKTTAAELLKGLTEKFPGSMLEVKDQSVAWHYRNAPKVSTNEIELLKNQFMPLIQAHGLQLLEGSKVLEIKHASFNKGTVVQQFLSLMKDAFMLAIGDDKTDEDIFRSIPSPAYTIKVGEPSTNARYYVRDQRKVLELLMNLLSQQNGDGALLPVLLSPEHEGAN